MMLKADQDPDTLDPEERLRQRLAGQYTQADPSASTASSATQDQPIDPAPFDQAPGETYTPPTYTPPVIPAQAQPTQTPAPAFSGGGGPPQPQDPYYAAYGAEHPGANTAAPVGTQLNYDNTPLASSNANSDRQRVTDAVGKWFATENKYNQQDPNYWIDKILNANGGPNQGNIDYFHERFLEDPNNNPHSPQNQLGAAAAPAAQAGGGLASYYTNPNQSVAQSFVGGLQQPGGMWNQDFMQQLRQILMQRLQASSQPVDPNAPNIESAMTAARDQASRSTDVERNALAERLYAQGGLNTDALTQQVQQSGERNATALGGLRATLIQKEVDRRQADLRDMMQMALAAGDAESAREIQMQLAALDAMMREEGYGIDLAKFSADLNQKAALAGMGA